MTLSPPLAVGFAVAGGTPIDASAWATVELDAFVEQRSRGILVATEPVENDGPSLEMARLAREMIVSELRAMDDLPPDEAIGRAFAAANGMLYDEGLSNPTRGYDRKVLVGATAILFDSHRCTIGHAPPGQVVLIEDGLAYTVPDANSWLPDHAVPNDVPDPPEPLGYTSWTAPILAQTELSDGDVVIICTASLAEALAIDLKETGMRVQDLAGHHGRSPDSTLDIFRGLLIADRIEDGAAIVVGFPPRPGSFGIVSAEDVRWRLRDRRRKVSAQARSLLPGPVRSMVGASAGDAAPRTVGDVGGDELSDDDTDAIDVAPAAGAEDHELSRWRRMRFRVSRRDTSATWNAPTQTQKFGIPQTHGVQVHRSVSIDRGDSGWRNALPRFPFGGAALAILALVIVGLLAFVVWSQRPDIIEDPADSASALGQVDQHILAAEDSTNPEDSRQALDLAQSALDRAREEGAEPDEIAPRQAAITEELDEIDNVIRVDNLTRVGTLPEDLRGGDTSAQLTGTGLFLVNGGLYQIRTDERQIIPILEQGEVASDVEVGDLFGIAMDATGLLVTDGSHVFTLQPDGTWEPIELGEINELGRWAPGPVGSFGGNLYILEPEYRNIYRFDTETEGVAEPSDWVLPSVRPDLVNAVDMTIDENIHVLLDNGTASDEVLVYRQGDLLDRYPVPYAEGGTPTSILIGTSTQFTYVAMQDGEDGWVVVFDTASDDAWQLQLSADFSISDAGVSAPFAGLQDVVIDESTGSLYIVNDDAVWTAQFELPVEVTGTPTPQPAEGGEGG